MILGGSQVTSTVVELTAEAETLCGGLGAVYIENFINNDGMDM